MPKISVVVPVYNVSQYLHQAINSLLNQTLKDIEVVCVNDGSTDGSLEILHDYEKKDNRVKVISKANSGYGHTMNVGILASTGEYLAILEPDDYILPNMYEDLYQIASVNDLDLVKADFYRFYGENEDLSRNYVQLHNEAKYYNRVIDPTQEPDVFRLVMNTWSGIYKLEFLKKHNILHNETPGASFQDNGFWFQTFCHSHRVYFVDKPYYMNRRDNPNSSVHNKEKVYCANVEYDFIKKFLVANNYWETFKDVYLMKKWHNYWFTYNRIGSEFKKEYLNSIKSEFVQELDMLNTECFSDNERKVLKFICTSPLCFFYCYKVKSELKKIMG